MRIGTLRTRPDTLLTLGMVAAIGCAAPGPRPEAPAETESPRPAPAATRTAAEPGAEDPSGSQPAAAVRPEPATAAGAANAAAIEDALRRSLAYLARDGAAWMHGESPYNQDNGCISCHVVGFTLWSHNAAADRGVVAEAAVLEALTAEAMEFIGRPRIGRPVTWSQLLLGRPAAVQGGTEWRSMVEGTLAAQERDGRWRARGQFPTQRRPIAESDAVATIWSLLAIFSVDEVAPEPAAVARAQGWLDGSTEGVSSEWLASRLLAALRLGSGEEQAEALYHRLLAEQRPDGGWSWLLRAAPGGDEDPSNAYSTGVALYILRQIGLERSHPAVAAAVGHLLSSQRADGVWEVPSRLISTEPDAAKDYIYEYWGTAWASIGLAEVLEPGADGGERIAGLGAPSESPNGAPNSPPDQP